MCPLELGSTALHFDWLSFFCNGLYLLKRELPLKKREDYFIFFRWRINTCGMLLGMMLALLSKRKEITQKVVSVYAATENYYGFGGCQTVISHTPENEMEKPRSKHAESIYSHEPFLG